MPEDDSTCGSLGRLMLAVDLTDALAAGWTPLLGACERNLMAAAGKLGIHSPRHVGIDFDRWTREARQELVDGFVAEHILPCWPALQIKARTTGLGGSYLTQMACHYLEDCRRLLDPIGTARFRKLRDLLDDGVRRGVVRPPADERKWDKHCEVCFVRDGRGRTATIHDLRADFASLPNDEFARLRKCLCSLGDEVTEVLLRWLDHLAGQDFAGFQFGELLTVLDEFFPVRTVALNGDDPEASSCLAIGLQHTDPDPDFDLEERLGECRRLLAQAAIRLPRRGLLTQLFDALVRNASNAETRANLAAIGRELGLDKRRASELREQLRSLLQRALRQNWPLLADLLSDRPSGSRRARPAETPDGS